MSKFFPQKNDDKAIPEEKGVVETLTNYKMKLDHAKMNGDEWVETSREVIDYFNRKSPVPKEGYFLHEGVRVCEFGMKDKILEREGVDRDVAIHNDVAVTALK